MDDRKRKRQGCRQTRATFLLALLTAQVILAICGTSPSQVVADEAVILPPLSDWSADTAAKAATVSHEPEHVLNAAVDHAHSDCFRSTPFPSAEACGKCHPQHYREWSTSPHAYAQMSPVFNAMSNKLIKLTNGTLGDFCIRCHTPVGMATGEAVNMSNLDRAPAAREGVTCVVCHRVNQAWGKGSGRLALVAGDVTQAVYGPIGSHILNDVMSHPDEYGALRTVLNSDERSTPVHARSYRFFQQTTSGFCGTCHDVFAPNGFRLEDAFSEYKQSHSALECGQNCQDCHMGKVPGKPLGYDFGPAAVVGNRATPPRKHTNHMMAGPDYPIIHRGLFPHNPKAILEERRPDDTGLATMRQWLYFDDVAGWGTPHFENSVDENTSFPPPWDDQVKRMKARQILNEQYALLSELHTQRRQVLRAGFHLGDICVEQASCDGIRFSAPVSNITGGHGVPTGFDAERVIFLRTSVWDANGRQVFQSGDLDPNGDVRDAHSLYVHNGKVPLDSQLFSLQSLFITRNLRGGEREQVLNVPYSIDPLPYIRPATRPFTVLGRPIGARKHKKNLEVGGTRHAVYEVTPNQLRGPGTYTIRVQLIAGMVPVNLVHEISDVGFDYGMSAKAVADGVVAGHMVLYDRTKTIRVRSGR
ncbi:MAG: multiheme c-type cytochrome [Fuerstiella sp.]|nr:multiheme c-type cytochrome [Fuerstiella sp.]